MRRIVATANTTIDGFMEGPGGEGDLGWLMPFVEDGLADNAQLLGGTDTILLGRLTYQGFSQYWPEQEDEFAALMNTPRKLVFAGPGSLSEVGWGKYDNAELVEQDVEQRVRELRAQDGKDLVILASGGLVSSLLPLGLVDELQIVVCPVLLGAGKRYLRGIDGQVGLELADAKPYPKGSVRLTYRTA
jgi:dihydrofolate reductase